MAAGLEFLVPSLDPWKGFTVAGPLPGTDGGKIVEIYLQRWPADKKASILKFAVVDIVSVVTLVWVAPDRSRSRPQ